MSGYKEVGMKFLLQKGVVVARSLRSAVFHKGSHNSKWHAQDVKKYILYTIKHFNKLIFPKYMNLNLLALYRELPVRIEQLIRWFLYFSILRSTIIYTSEPSLLN